MKNLLLITCFILCSSCSTNKSELKESKKEIIELNQKIDSLMIENKRLKTLFKKADNYIKVMEY